jgi:ATP-dependent Clp protease ATP-binding subunit ClpA
MFERFTQSARNAVVAAQDSARQFHHTEIGAEHVLLGVLDDPQEVPARVLTRLGVDVLAVIDQVKTLDSPDGEALKSIGIDLDEVRRRAEETFGPGALSRPRRQRRGLFGHRLVGGGHIPFTREAKSALELALKAALGRHDNYIGTEHLFLGLLDTEAGSAVRLLRQAGVSDDVPVIKSLVAEELKRSA